MPTWKKQHASCFTIVPMTIEAVQQVSDIEAICFSDPWSYQAFLGELDNPMSRTWLLWPMATKLSDS